MSALLETSAKEMNDTPSHAVKRYMPALDKRHDIPCMVEVPDGNYVFCNDYDQVRKQRDVLHYEMSRATFILDGSSNDAAIAAFDILKSAIANCID